MRIVFLELTNHAVKLTPARKSGRTSRFGAPAVFHLPKALDKPAVSDRPSAENVRDFAVFVKKCLRDAALKGRGIVFCLDAVTKEYQHLPAKRSDLLKLARLEAETVLPENTGRYVVANDEYGAADGQTGRRKSILYAVPDTLIQNLLKEFRSLGINIVKISPPISGLMNAAKTFLRLRPGEKATAVVDAGREKLRILLFCGNTPVFQKEFDSIYGELLEILEREEEISAEEAKREIVRPGFFLTAGKPRLRKATSENISLLIDTAAGEVIRNTRVVLSSDRLELEKVIFSGRFSSHPDFRQFVENFGLDVPFESAEAVCGAGLGIALDPTAAAEGLRPADFFALNGLICGKKASNVNLLCEENRRRVSRRADLFILAVLTAAAAAAMALEPVLYNQALGRRERDQSALSSPSYEEAKEVLGRQSSLQAKLKAAQTDRDALPEGSSAEIYEQIQKEIGDKVTQIDQCSVDYADGSVSLSFTVPGLDEFAAVRESVSASGYFTVEIPFTASLSTDGNRYLCTAALKVKDYQAYEPEAKNQEASSESDENAEDLE